MGKNRSPIESFDRIVAFAFFVLAMTLAGLIVFGGCSIHTEIRPHPFRPAPDLRPAPPDGETPKPEPQPKPRPWRKPQPEQAA